VELSSLVVLPAVAQLGNPPRVSSANPLLLEALWTGCTVSIDADQHTTHEGVLAVIPLLDMTGHIWGLVTVHEMPFITFQAANLHLLTIMGGYIGDLLMSRTESGGEQGAAAQAFKRQLRRSLMDALRSQVPAVMIAIIITSDLQIRDPLIQLICAQRRSLDQIWIRRNHAGQPVLLVLLPVTNTTGAEDYMQRLKQLAVEQFGLALTETGMIFHHQLLNSKKTAEEILTQFELKFEIVTQTEAVDAKANHFLHSFGIRDEQRLDLVG
jgi:hypothetical protein